MTKKKTAAAKRTAPRYEAKDLALMYLDEGAAAVLKLVQNKDVSVAVARKAGEIIRKLKGNKDSDVKETFTAALDKLAPRGIIGKVPPKVGETRPYKAQALKGKVFMRTPLDTLGIKKKDILDVTFEDDKIVIRKAGVAKRASA